MKTPNIPGWSSIRQFGNSYPSKFLSLMPFLGYFIVFNNFVIDAFSIQRPEFESLYTYYMTTSISGLYFLYFGLLLCGIASLLYHIACDHIVKKYEDADTFASATRSTLTLTDILTYSNELLSADGTDDVTRRSIGLAIDGIQSGSVSNINDLPHPLIQKSYYAMKDQSYKILRSIIVTLYITGGILFLMPSAKLLVQIIGTIY